MSAPMRHRRRAERFAQLLDEAEGGRRQRRRASFDDELMPLLELRQQLDGAAPAPEIDPEFRTGLRAMLVATAEREGIGATATDQAATHAEAPIGAGRPTRSTSRPGNRRSLAGPRTRTAVIAGVAVGAVAFTGMSAASEDAMPGDPLYGVKRSTERAQLALASSDMGRGQLYLEFARTRLLEATTLTGTDLDRVLEDMDRDTHQGVRLLTTAAVGRDDPAVLEVVQGFVDAQRTRLDTLAEQATGDDQERIAASLDLLDQVEERIGELDRSLEEDCGAVSTSDALGPVPSDCVTLPTPGTLPPPPLPSQRSAEATPQDADQEQDPESPIHSSEAPDHIGVDSRPDSEEPTTDDEEPPANGGLLDGLNRLLGDLLGG